MIPFITNAIAKPHQLAIPSDDSSIDQMLYGTPGQFDLPPGFEPMEGMNQRIRKYENLLESPSYVGNAPYDRLVILIER